MHTYASTEDDPMCLPNGLVFSWGAFGSQRQLATLPCPASASYEKLAQQGRSLDLNIEGAVQNQQQSCVSKYIHDKDIWIYVASK